MKDKEWAEFWVAFDNVDEKAKWVNSIYLNEKEKKIVNKMFLDAVERLMEESAIFYDRLKLEDRK